MNKGLTVLDLFSGAGGFSAGFQMAGFDIIGAIELDKWAAETFEKNHPGSKVLVSDISKISNQELKKNFGKPDIILGGPPCQGFSICTKNAGDPKDPRNSLFKEFIRAVKVLEPSVVILENVPNLINAKTESKKKVVELIEGELTSLGYHVESKILEAVLYGVPQIRKRLFVIGTKKIIQKHFPEPTHNQSNPLTVWDAISDLPDVEPREGSEVLDYDKPPNNKFQELMRGKSKKVFNHKSMKHSKRMIERFSTMKCGDSSKNVPKRLRPFKRNGNGEISKKVYDQNNRRMHPNRPCHTIPASFYANFVHPSKHRNFTAREGARIQTFPDTFRFYGKPTVVSHKLLEREDRLHEKFLCQYSQIGNAVPPLLAKAIAINIKSQVWGK